MVVRKSNYDLTKRLRARLQQIGFKLSLSLDHFNQLKEVDTVNKMVSLGFTVLIVADSFEIYG